MTTFWHVAAVVFLLAGAYTGLVDAHYEMGMALVALGIAYSAKGDAAGLRKILVGLGANR